MGNVIRFPSNGKNSSTAVGFLPSEQQLKMERILRRLLAALRRGSIKPEHMFVLFTQADTVSYLNLEYRPDELVKAVDLVLQDIARGYDPD